MIINSPFDSQNIVGYVSEVSAQEIKVHFPDSTYLNRFYNHGKSYHGGIVGSYVVIEGETKGFIGKIIKVSLPEKEKKNLTEEKYKYENFHPVGIVESLFSFDSISYEPEKSINNYPSVGEKVYVTSSEFYLNLINKDKDEYGESDKILIGEDLVDGKNIEISANKIFSRHCAIVGTTGGGKSYTVSKLIDQLIHKEGAKVLLLDPTGEFSSLDGIKSQSSSDIVENYKFNNGENSVFFDSNDFVFDDYIALFRPAGQVQLPKLMEALKSLEVVALGLNIDSVKHQSENTLNSPYIENGNLKKFGCSEKLYNRFCVLKESELVQSKINIKKLGQQVYNECFYVNNEKWTNENDRDKGNCSSLVVRITNTIYDKVAKSIFNFENSENQDKNVITKIDNFILCSDKNLLRLDFSNISSEKSYKEILVNAIGRKLLDKAMSETKPFRDKPLIVIIDEAHLFLNKKIKDEYSIEIELNSFERIAKECRKYGLFICISTQRPRDIPEGILSQMGTFIVHRLINDKDKYAIENAVSNYNKSFLNFLPSLGKGEALIMGVEFLTTLFLRIKKTVFKPDSDTPLLFKKQ